MITGSRGTLDDRRCTWWFRLASIMASSILPQFRQRTASNCSVVPWRSEICSGTTHPLHRAQFITASPSRCDAALVYSTVCSDDLSNPTPPVASEGTRCSFT